MIQTAEWEGVWNQSPALPLISHVASTKSFSLVVSIPQVHSWDMYRAGFVPNMDLIHIRADGQLGHAQSGDVILVPACHGTCC